ncbi:MAG TPA: polysaccharide deacetylase family protein [Xanthobacteraceae bacterium]|nr:polysaccharide deacetylase family protein [Xanthobacteraceae bacterium]
MLAPQVQLQANDPNSSPFPERLTVLASRFIARHSRSKTLPLKNAGPIVTFTFDDVPASACEVGVRLLERHGARGTFYVAGKGCGTAGTGGAPRASIDQLRSLWANGHEIGCHTYSHSAIRYISLEALDAELKDNRAVLQAIDSGIELRNFAYPYGDFSIRTKRHLEQCFDSCRSSHAGINSGMADLGSLHAWPLEDATITTAKISELVAETVLTSGWLIFFSHEVEVTPNRYGVSPKLLDWALRAAKDAGCALTGVAETLKALKGAEFDVHNGQPPQ